MFLDEVDELIFEDILSDFVGKIDNGEQFVLDAYHLHRDFAKTLNVLHMPISQIHRVMVKRGVVVNPSDKPYTARSVRKPPYNMQLFYVILNRFIREIQGAEPKLEELYLCHRRYAKELNIVHIPITQMYRNVVMNNLGKGAEGIFGEMTIAEISEAHSIPISTLYFFLHQSRKKSRNVLQARRRTHIQGKGAKLNKF